MPLLGRLKSASSGQRPSKNSPPTQNAQAQAQNPAPAPAQTRPVQQSQVCESPLFGMRSQLPLWSGLQQQQQQQQPEQQKQPNCDELSSVPQQMSKQQIHYAFTMMDTNKDGLIDLHDLSQMLANLGLPIDKAILSYIMSSVSKRGDQRVSEDEFLAWISNFIQISDSLPSEKVETFNSTRTSQVASLKEKSSSRVARAARSFTSVSSLAAQPGETARTGRRGSGSGLALMRSLSSSSANTSASPSSSSSEKSTQKASSEELSSSSADAEAEARNDLKAAFCVFDLDGDGFITLDEVRAGLRLLGETSWSALELHQLFSRCSSSSSSSASASASSTDLCRQQQEQRISIDDFVQLLL